MTDLGVWNVVRAGDRVVHERTAQQMTVAIKRGVLHHHLAPALGERALELTVGEQRVHDRPGVVEPRDALRRHHARVAVDPDRHDEGARAPHFALGAEEPRGLEPRLDARRKPLAAVGELGHAGPADLPSGRADDAEPALDGHDVLGRGFEEACRQPARLVAHVARRECQRRSAERGAPAPERPDTLRGAVRVAVANGHRLGRHTERVGDDLGERRLVPLAVGARSRDGEHGAGRLDANLPAFPAERGGLDILGDADPDDLAPGAPLRLGAS